MSRETQIAEENRPRTHFWHEWAFIFQMSLIWLRGKPVTANTCNAAGHSEFDLSLGYNTGLMPANSYLQNIQVNLTINNVLDRSPPFNFEAREGGREIRAYDARWSEYGRFMSLAVTKTW